MHRAVVSKLDRRRWVFRGSARVPRALFSVSLEDVVFRETLRHCAGQDAHALQSFRADHTSC